MAAGITHMLGGHGALQFKIPWAFCSQDFFRDEMAWLMSCSNIQLDPDDYDQKKGGIKYYHGHISRLEAEARLKQRKCHGAFLLRLGSNGQHVISVASPEGMMHIEVKVGAKGGKCLGKGAKEFADIAQMVLAYFGRSVEGFDVKFTNPVPPSHKDIAKEGASVDTLAIEKKKKKKKKKEKKKDGTTPRVHKIALSTMQLGEIRMLLEQNGIDYHHCNSRAELEQLAHGLEWRASERSLSAGADPRKGSQVSLLSTSSVGEISPTPRSPENNQPDTSLLPPPAVDLLPPGTSATDSLLPPSSEGSGINLFNKYKAKVTEPSDGGLSVDSIKPRGRTKSAHVSRTSSPPKEPTTSLNKLSKDDTFLKTGGNVNVDNMAKSVATDGGENTFSAASDEPQLSAMAENFFSSLTAETTEDSELSSATETPVVDASNPFASMMGASTSASPNSNGPSADEIQVAEASDSDSDTSDDSDSESEAEAEPSPKVDPHAKSHEFWDNMGKGPVGGRPPPPANSKAAERAAKRREKLKALASSGL